MILARQFLVLCIFFFFLLLSSCLSNSDVNTLLSFKASLSDDPYNSLSSWVSSTHPCFHSWSGVTCNHRTHRVIKLVLDNFNLTGSAHPLTLLTHLRLLSLNYNRFSSSSTFNFSSWPYIKHLYLSHNHFTGKFPAGIADLHRLRRLDLSCNLFTGEIPMTELSQLPNLLTLRLEANSFTGTLDSENLSSLSILDFNVSGNRLSGQIPMGLSRYPLSSFGGNHNLCGRPLPSACSHRTTVVGEAIRPPRDGRLTVVVVVIVIFDVVAMVAAIVTVTCYCYKKKEKSRQYGGAGGGAHKGKYGPRDEEQMVAFDSEMKGLRKVEDLLKSTAELLGKGSVGTTYKVELDGGDVVVVKRVRERKKRREVDDWVCDIGGVMHPNIVSLRAYYNSQDELLLVYDFLPSGSLHSLLHGNRGPGRTPVGWSTRLKLASDAAKGLAFLHCYKKAKIFHGNLTSSDILVDQLGNARVSDIGLYQLSHTPSVVNEAYKAPELKLNNNNGCSQRKFTYKCDVYSFGVVLLEILTGKMATGDGELSIVKWVRGYMGQDQENPCPWEVFDFELLRDREMEEEMTALLQVAFLCLAALPKDRPKMNMVYTMIEHIRTDGGIIPIMCNLSSDPSPSLSVTTYN